MSFNYPLADLVARLNVSSKRHLDCVRICNSSFNLRILVLLYTNGVVRGFHVRSNYILVLLKYCLGRPCFKQITVISRPGCRIFWSLGYLSLIYNYNNFSGFFVISSPKGLITSNDALLSLRLTGEILLKVSI